MEFSQNKVLKPGSDFEYLYTNYSLGVCVSYIKYLLSLYFIFRF